MKSGMALKSVSLRPKAVMLTPMSSLMESVIVPVIKNKNKRINDKGNYGPIGLCLLEDR